jgi:hypothetical protein
MVKAIFRCLEVHVVDSTYLNNQAEVNFNPANMEIRYLISFL